MPRAVARVNFKSDMNWGYIEGFRKAADILAKQVIKEGENPDYLIYPLGFLYHQHLELQLKWLIELAGQLLNESEKPHFTHDLMNLWNVLQPKLIRIEPNGDEFVRDLSDLIAEICIVDQSGEQFRYQSLSNGETSLEATNSVDIEAFALKRISISDALQAIRMALTARKDRLIEMLVSQSEDR